MISKKREREREREREITKLVISKEDGDPIANLKSRKK